MGGRFILFKRSLDLCRLKTEIFERGAPGLQSPQIDREQAGTSNHRFLSGRSAGGSSETKNVWEFLKTPPGGIPFLQAPDGFDQKRAHAPVAYSIDATKLLMGACAEFTRTTTDVAADLFSISESVPIDRFPL
jgi:hypothetical protein